MANSQQEVSISKITTVYPSRTPPSQRRLLQLSNLDRKCPVLMYLVFFYRPPPPSPPHQQQLSEESLFTSLKLGLEETLSTWYPASGRLSLSSSNGKLDLDCNNSGALLVQAAATHVKISQLGDLSQYSSFLENLVYRPPFSSNISEMPLVVAQVTKFGCGGYALGVGTSHSLFDGLASYNFLRAWASKATGKGSGVEEEELFEPVHERGRLLVGHGQQCGKAKVAVRVMAFEHLHLLIKQTASMELLSSEMSSGSAQENFVLKTFSISFAMVEKLKSKITRGMSGSSCSSFDVVAAHLWKARTKALGITNNRKVCLQFAVDTRTRMDPPLPKGFSGNAYVLSSISTTAGELHQETLSSIVSKIKEAKLAVTEGYVRAYLETLEAAPQASALPELPELTMVSDWTRTPYYRVDFGLGGAAYASPLTPPVPQVAYFMQSPQEDGGVHVRIGLVQKYVSAFSHYFLGVS